MSHVPDCVRRNEATEIRLHQDCFRRRLCGKFSMYYHLSYSGCDLQHVVLAAAKAALDEESGVRQSNVVSRRLMQPLSAHLLRHFVEWIRQLSFLL